MPSPSSWQKNPSLYTHHFFDTRPQFVFTEGRFDKWVMVVPEAGRFRYELEDESGSESGEAGLGDVICVAPQSLFCRSVCPPALTYHVLQWKLEASDDALEAMWTPGKWKIANTTRLLSDLAILRHLHYKLDVFSVQRREVVAQDVLQLLWETRHVLPPVADPLMQEAADLLRAQAEVGEVLSMKEVASRMGLGPVQFTRRFHAAHGVNPIEFLTAHRLEFAQKMLTDTDLTLDAIATRCGWTHGSYLSRIFVQHFGVTPGEFRRSHQEKRI